MHSVAAYMIGGVKDFIITKEFDVFKGESEDETGHSIIPTFDYGGEEM